MCTRENNDRIAEVTDLLIANKGGHTLICDKVRARKFINVHSMGHKGYQKIISNNVVTQDSRSQSLPDCLIENERLIDAPKLINCDKQHTPPKVLPTTTEPASPPQSPTNCENWFKTWPERLKNNETDIPTNTHTTNLNQSNNVKIKTKLSLNEALQNISIAYSPVTKQLHLVETAAEKSNHSDENVKEVKKGHRRTQADSFSSTISSVSDPSPSGSLLDDDERSLTSYDECQTITRKKSLTDFITRNVFVWKNPTSSPSVWKIFNRSKNVTKSPIHVVASSSALIQHDRPSNLPAKTTEEEQRHREEYKAILAAAKKKEALNTVTKQKLQKLQLQQEDHHASVTKHFVQNVLPNWETTRQSKKTRDLWWQGLPSSVRGKVWRLAIGNELNVTQQLYEICLSRAQNRLNSPEPSQCDLDVDQESSMDVIQLDISRTFPHLCIFQEGGPYSDVLHALLAAYVCYRPDVGYVQGMSYIAAILILNMDQYDAFICFANLLNQPLHLSAFTLNQTQMQTYYNAYNQVFNYNLPKLFMHFENAGLTPDLYLLDWIYTIFAKAMPLDIACRVWDIFLRDGYEFIFRTALGILHLNQESLLTMDFLHGAQFLTHLPDDMSSDQLFKSIQVVTTTIGKTSFHQIVEKCNKLTVNDNSS